MSEIEFYWLVFAGLASSMALGLALFEVWREPDEIAEREKKPCGYRFPDEPENGDNVRIDSVVFVYRDGFWCLKRPVDLDLHYLNVLDELRALEGEPVQSIGSDGCFDILRGK